MSGLLYGDFGDSKGLVDVFTVNFEFGLSLANVLWKVCETVTQNTNSF